MLKEMIGLSAFAATMCVLSLAEPRLAVEDGFVETASATLFAASSAALAWTVWRSRQHATTRRERAVLAAAAVGAWACATSEVSFGARLFGWEMPGLAGGGELDGFHDPVILAYRGLLPIIRQHPAAVLACGLLAFASLAALAWLARRPVARWAGFVAADPVYRRLGMAAGLLAFAVLLDLVPSYRLSVLEEAAELTASLATGMAAFAALARHAPARPRLG
jgi:hypothetical protein